jgi:signal transduction histidine kinase/CheY-like chemotaxis protein
VALVGLLWGGVRLWPAIVIGRILAGLTVHSTVAPVALVLLSVGTAAGAALPVAWRERVRPRQRWRPDLDDMLWLLLGGAVGGAVISSAAATGALWLTGLASGQAPNFAITWLTGFGVGVLVVAPLLLALAEPWPKMSGGQAAHLALCVGVTLALNAVVFLTPPSPFVRSWIIFPALVWAALAFRFRGAALAVFITSAATVAGAVTSAGPMTIMALTRLQELLVDQQFAAVCAITILALAAVTEERWASQTLLERRSEELETANAALSREAEARRLAERELAEAQKMEALGRLTGGIAHDFNNLMTVVKGSVDLMRSPRANPERSQRHMQAIADAADRASALTGQLLSFARRQALTPEVLDLHRCLDAFSDILRRSLGPGMALELRIDPDIRAVKADPTQLEVALLNLAINARDAGGAGTVTITARNDPGSDLVELSVRDDGPGMEEAVASRAFEPFFTTKGPGRGTGLGLSQVHGFAAQSGGRAWIDSAPGRGTTVHIALPATTEQPEASKGRASLAAPALSGPVLLVEDNPGVASFAQMLLADLGYDVRVSLSAEEALAGLEQDPAEPALLVTDVMMPGVSGIDLAEQLKGRWPGLPVVLATGYTELLDGRAAPGTVLRKPYGARELAEAIAAAV